MPRQKHREREHDEDDDLLPKPLEPIDFDEYLQEEEEVVDQQEDEGE